MLYLNDEEENDSMDLQRALLAADGYLSLGLPDLALGELDSLAGPEHRRSTVMRTRVRALLHQKRWAAAHELSASGAHIYPEENEFVVQRAFALHQLKKGGEAVQVLLRAPEWIRRTGILHYNLACYEAQLGDVDTARQCIRAAIEINSAFKKSARHDPDLQRLWN